MSLPASSERVRHGDAPGSPRREPAAGPLALGVIVPPLIALLNQEVIYGAAAPLCAHSLQLPLHAVPMLCVSIVAVLGLSALATYWHSRSAGPGGAGRSAAIGRTRFLAGLAALTAAVSALVILAQWLAVLMFHPCLQA
jgi:hypothetical protein